MSVAILYASVCEVTVKYITRVDGKYFMRSGTDFMKYLEIGIKRDNLRHLEGTPNVQLDIRYPFPLTVMRIFFLGAVFAGSTL